MLFCALFCSFGKEQKSESLLFALFEKNNRAKSERAKEQLPNQALELRQVFAGFHLSLVQTFRVQVKNKVWTIGSVLSPYGLNLRIVHFSKNSPLYINCRFWKGLFFELGQNPRSFKRFLAILYLIYKK